MTLPVLRKRRSRRYGWSTVIRRIVAAPLFYFGVLLVVVAALWVRRHGNDNPHQQLKKGAGGSDGYLLFCLGMGRYGNQMEHLLGVISQAKLRIPHVTLVLPSFIAYNFNKGTGRSRTYTPVEDVFEIDELRKFHTNIVTMSEFLHVVQHWNPTTDATIYCPQDWKNRMPNHVCNDYATTKSEWGPYYKSFGIHVSHEHYFNSHDVFDWLSSSAKEEQQQHQVVLLQGAPAPYPMRASDGIVAKYLHWTPSINKMVNDHLLSQGFDFNHYILVATHLRAGSDWVSSCERHGVGRSSYMASPQCEAEMKQRGVPNITMDICLPTHDMTRVASKLKAIGERLRQQEHTKKKKLVLFVASDVPTLGKTLFQMHGLDSTYESLLQPPMEANPFLDLAIMTRADYFVGNCVSSFTSFAARIRIEQGIGFGTGFYGLL